MEQATENQAPRGRMAYLVQRTVVDEQGNYVPCIAVEGERGYYRTNWQYGKDFELASECCDELNKRLGLTTEDALTIILGTMGG